MSSITNPDNYVNNLKKRLIDRLKPLRVLTSGTRGVSIPLARSFYIMYIRSLLDYHAIHLSLLPTASLKPLEKVQNMAMRIILHCPMTTRIVNMLHELNLSTVTDRVHMLGTSFGAQCLAHFPSPAPAFTSKLVDITADHTKLQHVKKMHGCGLENWLRRIRCTLCPILHLVGRDPDSIKDEITSPIPADAMPPAWVRQPINIYFTPHNKSQNQLCAQTRASILETLSETAKEFPSPPIQMYCDGSLLQNGRAGAAYIAYDAGVPIRNYSHRLPNWSSSTHCELSAINSALSYLITEKISGVIVTDSQAALALVRNPPQHSSPLTASIHTRLHHANTLNLQISFVWIPAHVGFTNHDQVDKLAKKACLHPSPEVRLPISKSLIKRLLRDEARDEDEARVNTERPESGSIKHYDQFRGVGHCYGKHSTLTRACDIAVPYPSWIPVSLAEN